MIIRRIINKFGGLQRDLQLFLAAIFVFGFSQSIVEATFNNYLNETFSISDFQRGFLELPRELPGFLVVFVAALLFFLCTRRLAALANLLCALGILLIGIYSPTFSVMLIWLFIFSIGQHLFIPLNQSIGMELARDGRTGRRLGQLSGIANLSSIIGSFAILIGFKFFNLNFKISYIVAFLGFLTVALLIFLMQKNKPLPARTKFKLKKEYSLFYWLNILYGTRKQIFLTFAPWVLVTVFKQQTYVVATLLMAGGIIGIFFKPLLGKAIDRFGERFILTAEAVILVFVCLGYGFSSNVFPETTAMYIAFFCYVVDQLLMSVSMARATYLQKIAVTPEDVNQTLTMGVTIDHAFSIAVALLGGLIWISWGYQYVFLLGVIIAVINTFSALRIKTKSKMEFPAKLPSA
ncbi:MAG: MFS transporter [Deltaproteobacteria bacterium HGW-Deltaproteobacteria-12]|nr:MAG: MFS transporter [Deltaproteobacteria bacterium HGW-Deltaproteobacteria-12]